MTTYGPPTAQEHLRASMHGSINYVNRAPMCCCDGFDTETLVDPKRRSKLWYWIAGAAVIIGCIGVARYASGAERSPYEIVLQMPPIEAEPDRRGIFVLSHGYADKDICERAKTRLVVMVKGGKVLCLPAETARVR